MKIKCTTLENEPGSVSNGVKCLREGSETITEQASDACWGNDAPACLFDHQNKRAVRCPDRGDQLFTEVIKISLLLRKTANLGRSGVPKETLRIRFWIRCLLSSLLNPIVYYGYADLPAFLLICSPTNLIPFPL